MIALNELLKNINTYKSAYELMGLKVDLGVFVCFENKLKNIQLTAEHFRADCNKKCGELIKLKSENQNVDELLKDIISLDKKAIKFQSKLNIIKKKLDRQLKKLHNLPDNNNVQHLQIESDKKESSLDSLNQHIEKLCATTSIAQSSNAYLKHQAGKVFSESDLPIASHTKNGFVILCSQQDADRIFDNLLNYFKQNSLSIIERSITKLKKSSSRELFIHLKHKVYLKLELKREFFTREHKIKYHDKSTDMTKFISQIDLLF